MKDVYVVYAKTGKLFIDENNNMVENGNPGEFATIGEAMEKASYWNNIVGYPTFKVFSYAVK